jgi:hypothetical protein
VSNEKPKAGRWERGPNGEWFRWRSPVLPQAIHAASIDKKKDGIVCATAGDPFSIRGPLPGVDGMIEGATFSMSYAFATGIFRSYASARRWADNVLRCSGFELIEEKRETYEAWQLGYYGTNDPHAVLLYRGPCLLRAAKAAIRNEGPYGQWVIKPDDIDEDNHTGLTWREGEIVEELFNRKLAREQ